MVLLVACATHDVGQHKGVTVIFDTESRVSRACQGITGVPEAAGCSWITPEHTFVLCPVDHPGLTLAQCVAHEVCHVQAKIAGVTDRCHE